MSKLEILAIQPFTEKERARIEGVDPSINLTDAGGWFDGEIRDTWPAFTANRYVAPDAKGKGTREERDRLLANAEVILGGWPFPLDLRARSPKLKWFHQRPAGASNLRLGDLWGSDVMVTSSRGYGNTVPMAEYVLASILYFARGLHHAAVERANGAFDHRAYKPVLVEGKTVCVIGAGGIGLDVGRLCAGIGMRVVGTRRRAPDTLPEGFSEIRAADGLNDLLAESDFVAVCCQWTPETTNLINDDTLARMKPGGILINVARGEIVDEEAVLRALASGHLRGVGLDVYVGEFEHLPDPRLWEDPRVLITPHVSGGSDVSRHRAIDVFCDNLKAYIEGRPLENVIDWELGY
jgi:phosphoglycerate dehydrogenase-like enzyme